MMEPTVTCFAIDDTLLVSYLDGELDPTTARLVEDQFDIDPATRERMALLQMTDELLREALEIPEHTDVSPALRAKVENLIRQPRSRLRPLMSRRTWMPMAAAAVIGGFVFAGSNMLGRLPFGNGGNSAVAHVLNEVAEYHAVYASEAEHLVEMPASRQPELEAWLSKRVKFAFAAPDLRAHDLEFQGGRLLAVDSQPVAQLMYTGKDGGVVALCIALTSADASSGLQQREDDDLTTFGKGVGHHVFVVIGSSSNTSLRAIAESMPESLRRS
jgi:anti-sigma factor RsiW